MNPLHELRRALITAWLLTFDDYHPDAPDLRQTVRRDIERLVLMWLRTPHSTVMMWIDSEPVTDDELDQFYAEEKAYMVERGGWQ